MATRPGTTKHAPPIRGAGQCPRTLARRTAMASWVEAGPGRRLVAAIPSSNSTALSQWRSVTHSCRSMAMWVGGPPNPEHADPTPLAGAMW